MLAQAQGGKTGENRKNVKKSADDGIFFRPMKARLRGQRFSLIFLVIPRYSLIFLVIPRYSLIFPVTPRYSLIFLVIPRYSPIFPITPRYSPIFPNKPHYSPLLPAFPCFSLLFLIRHHLSAILHTSPLCHTFPHIPPQVGARGHS